VAADNEAEQLELAGQQAKKFKQESRASYKCVYLLALREDSRQ
jgi:hypothetical protein